MTTFTKTDPGCFHSLLDYLAELENTEPRKRLRFSTQEELRDDRGKLRYPSYRISVINGQGELHPYMINSMRYDHPKRNIVPDYFSVLAYKTLDDFTTPVSRAGSYQDSCKGGGYIKVPMYIVNGRYFAEMDCSC